MLFLRNSVEANILRLPGQLFEHKENNIISNVYTFKVVNKTSEDIENVRFELMSHEGTIKLVSHDIFTVPAQGLSEGTLFIEVKANLLKDDKERINIGVYSGDVLIESTSTSFLGPRSYR